MKNNTDIQEIKKKQVEQIKDCITNLVNKYPDYYKDKEHAQKFLNKKLENFKNEVKSTRK